MLNKCQCGKYTDYGPTCVSCSTSKGDNRREIDEINIDDLIMTPDIEDTTSDAYTPQGEVQDCDEE